MPWIYITAVLSEATVKDVYNRFKKQNETVDPDILKIYLKRWDAFKESKKLLPIEKYKNFSELENAVKDLKTKKEREADSKKIDFDKIEVVYSDGEWEAIKTSDAKALSSLARGSAWCIRSASTAEDYIKREGPFTIVFKNKLPFAAIAGENGGVWYKTDSDFESNVAYGIKEINVFENDYKKLQEIMIKLGRPLKPIEGKINTHSTEDGEQYLKKLIDDFDYNPLDSSDTMQQMLAISGLREDTGPIPEIEKRLGSNDRNTWLAYSEIIAHKAIPKATELASKELDDVSMEYFKLYNAKPKVSKAEAQRYIDNIVAGNPSKLEEASKFLNVEPSKEVLERAIDFFAQRYEIDKIKALKKYNVEPSYASSCEGIERLLRSAHFDEAIELSNVLNTKPDKKSIISTAIQGFLNNWGTNVNRFYKSLEYFDISKEEVDKSLQNYTNVFLAGLNTHSSIEIYKSFDIKPDNETIIFSLNKCIANNNYLSLEKTISELDLDESFIKHAFIKLIERVPTDPWYTVKAVTFSKKFGMPLFETEAKNLYEKLNKDLSYKQKQELLFALKLPQLPDEEDPDYKQPKTDQKIEPKPSKEKPQEDYKPIPQTQTEEEPEKEKLFSNKWITIK